MKLKKQKVKVAKLEQPDDSLKCRFCGCKLRSANAHRFGACFMCVEIESIVIDGEEMDSSFIPNGAKTCVSKNEKIAMIKKHYPSMDAEYWYLYHTKRVRQAKLIKLTKR